MEVLATKKEILTGIVISLNVEDIAHMETMLNDYQRLMREHRNINGGIYWPWVEQLERRISDIKRGMLMGTTIVFALLLCVASSVSAQSLTLTNADLGKRHAVAVPVTPEILAAMHEREYHAPPKPQPPSVRTSTSKPGALSWLEFPPERPARRLDGTLLSDPITIYGDTRRRR